MRTGGEMNNNNGESISRGIDTGSDDIFGENDVGSSNPNHSDGYSLPTEDSQDSLYSHHTCNICFKIFQTAHSLRKHLIAHTISIGTYYDT